MAIAIHAFIPGAGGRTRSMVPHKFRDGFFRMQEPNNDASCLHVEDLRSVCRYLNRGYRLAMSAADGHAMPSWMGADKVKIAIR
ncbi:hypothetical protein RMQ97_06185 [Maricaulis sp. D1M11]|uniref:hypothetical protein n=1 Tax=Maricaulis sp. D1M11 TaxID=3076117 RepID=UPI0039B512C2